MYRDAKSDGAAAPKPIIKNCLAPGVLEDPREHLRFSIAEPPRRHYRSNSRDRLAFQPGFLFGSQGSRIGVRS
jgi:hypothetical protein